MSKKVEFKGDLLMKTSVTIALMLILLAGVVVGAKVLAAPALPTTPSGAVEITTISPACNPEATGNLAPELRFEVTNPLNTAKENKVDTVRVYKVAADTDASTQTIAPDAGYVGTVTTSSSGLIADGSGFACGCDQTYLLVTTRDQVAASSDATGNTSTSFTMVCEENDNTVIASGSTQQPDLSGLEGRCYDNDGRAYAYSNKSGDGGTASGTWLDLSSENASCEGITAGAWETPVVVGTDGYLDYTITIKTNSSTATDSQFNDQSLLIGIDLQSEDDWAEPATLDLEGDSLLDDEIDCPTKIANLGIDYCYLVPNNPKVSTSAKDLDIYIETLSGVNADDEIEIHFFTSGWIASTVDNSASVDYSQDNPAKALVYLGNNITLTTS